MTFIKYVSKFWNLQVIYANNLILIIFLKEYLNNILKTQEHRRSFRKLKQTEIIFKSKSWKIMLIFYFYKYYFISILQTKFLLIFFILERY